MWIVIKVTPPDHTGGCLRRSQVTWKSSNLRIRLALSREIHVEPKKGPLEYALPPAIASRRRDDERAELTGDAGIGQKDHRRMKLIGGPLLFRKKRNLKRAVPIVKLALSFCCTRIGTPEPTQEAESGQSGLLPAMSPAGGRPAEQRSTVLVAERISNFLQRGASCA